MTAENIKSATEVVTEFLGEQIGDHNLDAITLSVIADLRGQGKLTKTNLLRRLEEARKAAAKRDGAARSQG